MSAKYAAVGWPSTVIEEWDREQLRRNNLDPKQVPTEPYHIKRAQDVADRYKWSIATLYRRMADKENPFPRPIPLGPAKRAVEECAA